MIDYIEYKELRCKEQANDYDNSYYISYIKEEELNSFGLDGWEIIKVLIDEDQLEIKYALLKKVHYTEPSSCCNYSQPLPSNGYGDRCY